MERVLGWDCLGGRQATASEEVITQPMVGARQRFCWPLMSSADPHQGPPPSKPDNTLIYATPSKPRLADSVFGPRLHSCHPTPIQEEPSSGERPRPFFVAETPVAPGRIAAMPISALTSVDEDDDDSLGDLMVMTDDEDEGNEDDQ